MGSNSETGHAINVANFEDLISFCQGYGAAYNPSKTSLQIAKLQTQFSSVKANMTAVINTVIEYDNAVSARARAFDELKRLTPRLVNALGVTDASKELMKDAKSVRAKLLGLRLTKEKPAATAKTLPPLPDTPPVTFEQPKVHSSSQQSYDSLVEHFTKLIGILSSEPSYAPNEPELQIATLNNQLTGLQNANTVVITAYTKVSNARFERDQSLYNAMTGLCAVAQQVKVYVKATFGASSNQYRQLAKVSFHPRKV